MARRLERDLIAAGERVIRVPPKLMAHPRDAARTYGKSDHLVAERTRIIARLRWHLHELDPAWAPPAKLDRTSAFDRDATYLAQATGPLARLAATLVEHCRRLTVEIDDLATEIGARITKLAPSLLAIVGCAELTAAKIIGETAGVDRFRSKDAYARHNGTAPLPVWSSNHERHRLLRTGNRQLNAAIHRIALTQARCHPGARELLARRKASGDGGMEALRSPQTPNLRRRLPRHGQRPSDHEGLTEEQATLPSHDHRPARFRGTVRDLALSHLRLWLTFGGDVAVWASCFGV